MVKAVDKLFKKQFTSLIDFSAQSFLCLKLKHFFFFLLESIFTP